MTRRDYILLADALHDALAHTQSVNYDDTVAIVDTIGKALRSDNPRFDDGRFYARVMAGPQ